MSLRGFGFTFDLKSGAQRQWYAGADGVQRWLTTGEPVKPNEHTPIFPPIDPPNCLPTPNPPGATKQTERLDEGTKEIEE